MENATPGTRTEELGGVCLTLREDLTFTLQSFGGETCYVLEDEAHGAFFRIGVPEYTFLSLLNGRTSVEQALALTAVALGPDAIREQDAASICKWLIDHQLASTAQSGQASRLHETREKQRAGRWKQYLNPMVFTIKLVHRQSFRNSRASYLERFVVRRRLPTSADGLH